MINDDVMFRTAASNVVIALPALRYTPTHPNVPHHDIVGIDIDGSHDAYAITRGRLTGNGDVGKIDVDVVLDGDVSRYTEDHDTGPFCFKGGTQAPFAPIVQIGNSHHFPPASTLCKHAATPRTGKSRDDAFRQPWWMWRDLSLCPDNQA